MDSEVLRFAAFFLLLLFYAGMISKIVYPWCRAAALRVLEALVIIFGTVAALFAAVALTVVSVHERIERWD